MKHLKTLLLGLSILSIISCSKNDEEDNTSKDNYDRKALFSHLGNTIVLPTFLQFVDASDSLVQASQTFQNDLDKNSFITLQDAWLNAKLTSKRVELMKFGPLNDTKMYSLIDKWATNDGFIEDFIAGTDPINESFINLKGATSKGLPAIEYLLFSHSDIDSALANLSADSRRIDYVVACSQNLYQKSLELASLWSPLGDNFIEEYSTNTTSGLDGSLSLTVNQLSSHIEFMTVTKVGKPLGIDLGSGVRTTYLESFRSQTSKEALLANLQIFRLLFTGGEADSNGFDDYLDYLGTMKSKQPLSTAILDQVDLIEQTLNSITPSMVEELNQSTDKVNTLYEQLKALLVLVKTDMTSALSVTLTFSDNDGD